MSSPREKVLTEALQLPKDDRAAIASALLRSLDADEDEDANSVEEAWTEEIRRRLQALDEGTAEGLSIEEARRLITSDVPGDDR